MILNTIASIIRHPLGRRNKLAALCRFFRWQIGSRLVPGPVVFHWVNDSRLIVGKSEHGLTFNLYCGLHEFIEMAFCLHFLRPADVFFDIGANYGSYTVLASSVIGARTYSFEPVNTSFLRLVQNIRINNVESIVSANNIGLAAEERQLCFSADQNCTNHVIDSASIAGVKQMQLVKKADSFVDDGIPALMKIDVEGFEAEVLTGAKAILSSNLLKAIIIELNGSGARYGHQDASIRAELQKSGFSEYFYEPFKRRLELADGRRQSENCIFIRDLNFVAERILSAPGFEVFGRRI